MVQFFLPHSVDVIHIVHCGTGLVRA